MDGEVAINAVVAFANDDLMFIKFSRNGDFKLITGMKAQDGYLVK